MEQLIEKYLPHIDNLESEPSDNIEYDLRVGTIETLNGLNAYPLQIKCPINFRITGFLATFTTSINIVPSSDLWGEIAIIGDKTIAHAVNVNNGLMGTNSWQTVLYLDSDYHLNKSNEVDIKTNQYPCTLDIVDSNNNIITYPIFLSELQNESSLLLRNFREPQLKAESEQKKFKVSDIRLLVCTHGEIGSGFWDEVDKAFIELNNFYNFELKIERFGEAALTQQAFLEAMNEQEDLYYNAICSTVLTPEIGNALNNISSRIPVVTYNTSVLSIPNAIEYVGGGSDGERNQGLDLAIQMGLYVLDKLDMVSDEMNFDSIKNKPDLKEQFINILNNISNMLVITHTQDLENQAFLDRHTGVLEIFADATYYKGEFNALKSAVRTHQSISNGKEDPIVLGLCLHESILADLSAFLSEEPSIQYIVGVADITSGTISLLDDTNNSLVALSGSPPINQGNLTASIVLNKIYGIFGGNISNLQEYTPIGNSQSKSFNISSGVNFSSVSSFQSISSSGSSSGSGSGSSSGSGSGNTGTGNFNNRGDINNDGKLGTADATYLLSHLANINGFELDENSLVKADVNNNGTVNTLDANHLLSHLAGISGYETLDPISPYEHSSNIMLLDHYDPQIHCNDCWGYTSPSGIKYSLMGYFDKLSIFRIVNDKLILISEIPHGASIWSDVKVYQNYCYCVNETGGGIQIISLEQIDTWVYPHTATVNTILDVSVNGETKLTSTAHNVYVDEINGILYVLGSVDPEENSFILNRHPQHPSSGFNYMFALNSNIVSGASAQQPILINHQEIYFHDLVTYTYNDSKTYAYASGEDTGIYVLDVTDPFNWDQKHILDDYQQYTGVSGYMHQIWYSSDGRYIFANDEFLETNTLIVYDLKPFLDDQNVPPKLILFNNYHATDDINGNLWSNGQVSSNHNLYIHNINGKDHIFHSCYKNGLRVYVIHRDTNGNLHCIKEIGYFDTYYQSNGSGTAGQWSNYYWNDSEGLITVSDTENGTFLLKYTPESD